MKYLKFLILFLILSSCAKDKKTLISKNRLGDLTNSIKISEIENMLPEDSIVTVNARNAYGEFISSAVKQVEVYDTSDQQVLVIKPFGGMDTLSKIRSIRVLSKRYKTKNGIGLGSTYKDLKKYHDVSNIQSLANSIIITLNDINAVASFDRNVLPGEVRFDMEADIKPTMIPDNAKINRFWINFSEEVDVKE